MTCIVHLIDNSMTNTLATCFDAAAAMTHVTASSNDNGLETFQGSVIETANLSAYVLKLTLTKLTATRLL
ncbi:hypothetical protein J6590_014144 [Homalodisca vitripennis]|nr:hypothetical protein J6590_014144 [Homalodisca vitripennis]